MESGTFSVKEFNPIYSMIEENSNRISVKTDRIISLCEQLSQLTYSTDSNLANSYLRVGETFGTVRNKVIDLLSQLETEIKLYETKTLYNEEEADTQLENINANIEEISNIFNNISSKNG